MDRVGPGMEWNGVWGFRVLELPTNNDSLTRPALLALTDSCRTIGTRMVAVVPLATNRHVFWKLGGTFKVVSYPHMLQYTLFYVGIFVSAFKLILKGQT